MPMKAPAAVRRKALSPWPGTGRIHACNSRAMRMPTKATIEPTERSMPPERMTNDSPTAATPTNALIA